MTKTFSLSDEYAKLFSKEELLAFCDIAPQSGAAQPLTGLCKFAKPRPGASSLNYLSVLFVFDTPDQPAWRRAKAALSNLEGPHLKSCLKDLDSVVAAPNFNLGNAVYVKQIDCLFRAGFTPSREYVLEELHPALSSTIGLPLGELQWWDDAPAAAPAAPAAGGASLFAELRHMIVGPWRGE